MPTIAVTVKSPHLPQHILEVHQDDSELKGLADALMLVNVMLKLAVTSTYMLPSRAWGFKLLLLCEHFDELSQTHNFGALQVQTYSDCTVSGCFLQHIVLSMATPLSTKHRRHMIGAPCTVEVHFWI